MGFFDVVDEIAGKQIQKTETGDNRIFGVAVGTVAKNFDQNMPGRVCVTVPTRDEEANELKWARVCLTSGGNGWGHYFLPEVGDQVLLAFEQGNMERPYVIGCILKDNDRFLKKAADEDNTFKKITTKNGSTITFEDKKEGEGEKDKILISTAKDMHRIELDNEKHTVQISDKEGKNRITMKTEAGQMELLAEKKLTIQVGDNIQMILNGSSGTVQLKADKLKVEAGNSVGISGNSKVKLNGGNVTVEAGSMLKLSSSGAVTVEGMPIRLG